MSADQTSLEYLVGQLKERDALIAAQKRRIEFLETRLAQRSEETKSDFQRLKPFFGSIQKKILEMFHDLSPERGLTMPELQEEFSARFPNIAVTNVPWRVFELCQHGDLWKQPDPVDLHMRYYLKLKGTDTDAQASQILNGEST